MKIRERNGKEKERGEKPEEFQALHDFRHNCTPTWLFVASGWFGISNSYQDNPCLFVHRLICWLTADITPTNALTHMMCELLRWSLWVAGQKGVVVVTRAKAGPKGCHLKDRPQRAA